MKNSTKIELIASTKQNNDAKDVSSKKSRGGTFLETSSGSKTATYCGGVILKCFNINGVFNFQRAWLECCYIENPENIRMSRTNLTKLRSRAICETWNENWHRVLKAMWM